MLLWLSENEIRHMYFFKFSILQYEWKCIKHAGVAVVTMTEALLWTDGRYHLQASKQLDQNWTLMKQG